MKTRIEQQSEIDYQISVMRAKKEGKQVWRLAKEQKGITQGYEYAMSENEQFDWINNTYEAKEEPKQIPFDGSDAIRLMKRIFREQNEDICYRPLNAGKDVINLGFESFTYEELIINKIEIWNEEKEVWESCSKPF